MEQLVIDATVTDSTGRTVPGLSAADFEILQAGKPHQIADAAYVRARAGAPTAAAASFDALAWPAPLPGGRTDDSHLTLAVVVDDLSLSPGARSQVQSALAKFIDSQVQARDLAAIVRTSGGTGASQQLTSDHGMLHASLDLLSRNPTGAASATNPPRVAALTGGTHALLRSVLDGMHGLPGRKTVVLFSENMQLYRSPQVLVDLLTARANRSSVVFYTVDPRGLRSASAGAQSLDRIPTYAGVGALARDTGGIFFDNTNDAATVMSRVLQDQDGYYRIVCATDEPAELVKGIALRVKHEGLRVRSRNEFPTSDVPQYAGGTEPPMSSLLPASPFATGGIHLRLTPLVSYGATSSIEVLLHIDIQDLTFTRDLQGFHNAELEVVAAGFSGSQETRGISQSYKLRMPDAIYAMGRSQGVTATVRLPMVPPGPLQVHAVVRDTTSGRLGSARQSFDFPDLKSGQLVISGIFLSGAQDAATGEPGENSAVRIFKAGRTLTYVYSVFNARMDTEKRSRLESQVRVFRDGQQIYTNDPVTALPEPEPDPLRRTRKGNLRLLPNAKPGQYVLEIAVTDRTEGGAPRTAAQSIDFEVR